MYVLNVEKRNEMIKAKKLKKAGMVPGSVYGGDLKETLLIQIPEGEARKLLKSKLKGGNLTLECDGKRFNVLLKEIDCNPVNSQIDNLSFQNLIEDEKVVHSLRVVSKIDNSVESDDSEEVEVQSLQTLMEEYINAIPDITDSDREALIQYANQLYVEATQ